VQKGNARGAQENLWPKFIFKSAPLRATSSGVSFSTLFANLKSLKRLAQRAVCTGRICRNAGKIYVCSADASRMPKHVEIPNSALLTRSLAVIPTKLEAVCWRGPERSRRGKPAAEILSVSEAAGAERDLGASRANCRVFCDLRLARLARFTIKTVPSPSSAGSPHFIRNLAIIEIATANNSPPRP